MEPSGRFCETVTLTVQCRVIERRSRSNLKETSHGATREVSLSSRDTFPLIGQAIGRRSRSNVKKTSHDEEGS